MACATGGLAWFATKPAPKPDTAKAEREFQDRMEPYAKRIFRLELRTANDDAKFQRIENIAQQAKEAASRPVVDNEARAAAYRAQAKALEPCMINGIC